MPSMKSPLLTGCRAALDQRFDDLAEGKPPRFIVAELVEAGAGWRQHDDIAGLCRRDGLADRLDQHFTALHGHVRLQDLAKKLPGIADRISSGDMRKIGHALVEVVALG